MATTTPFDFSNWPPTLSSEQLEELQLRAETYALAHGLLYLPPYPPQAAAAISTRSGPPSAIHAPISLLPSPFPRSLFNHARKLQSEYNRLYSRIAMNAEFLDRVMGAEVGVGTVDEFTGQLWKGWKALRDKGVSQSLHLGLFRSDYLLHALKDQPASLRQVEFNTISSSFGPLSERAAALHRHLAATTSYFDVSPFLKQENFPPNETTSGLVQGLKAAHAAYGVESSQILFVVQPGERNIFDQRWLEYELLERHSIKVVRRTFDQLAVDASVNPTTSVLRVSDIEISTVYFRAGYTPNDYPSSSHYATRFLLEGSRAIQCPSIPLQLAGGKKVQQILAEPNVLDQFLDSLAEGDALKTTWMGMWALESALELVRSRHMELVLKPQREGGGNNVYKEAIPAFLDGLPESERAAWIAMELIIPPEGVQNYLVRAEGDGKPAVLAEVVSELGIFGWSLFGDGEIKEEKGAGWLVRTKGKESNEGGVATGFSVLDSVVLVDS